MLNLLLIGSEHNNIVDITIVVNMKKMGVVTKNLCHMNIIFFKVPDRLFWVTSNLTSKNQSDQYPSLLYIEIEYQRIINKIIKKIDTHLKSSFIINPNLVHQFISR